MPPGGTLFLESSSLTVREYTYRECSLASLVAPALTPSWTNPRKFVVVASLTVLLYEYFTTLYLEVDFIWK